MNVGERIRSLRKQKGFTQKELSTLSAISEISIRKYENGDRQPKQKAIYQLAKALNVSETWLMGYDVPMERLNLGEKTKKIKEFEKLVSYLESIGYIIRFEQSKILECHKEDMIKDDEVIKNVPIIDKETFDTTITKGSLSVTFTEAEFEDFKSTIEKSIEFEIYKGNQNKK